MGRTVLITWCFALALALPVAAQGVAVQSGSALPMTGDGPTDSLAGCVPVSVPLAWDTDGACSQEPPPWQAVWGVAGLRAFAAGPKEAPNGQEYHPHSTLDLDFNLWVWRTQGLYLFADLRFWNERPEYGVTNGRDDTTLGFSKRQFDLVGGPAWNYYGPWEARLFGYTYNNLNRGLDQVKPAGLNDGFGLENRFYVSEEYARLGRAGFDVERADFVSVGYYLTKEMVGNDGRRFYPGLLLRASLTRDLGDWPVYAFGDVSFLSERSLQPRLLLFDLGMAARPFRLWESLSAWRNWEVRLGAENTGDFHTRSVQNLWYAALHVVF